MDGREANAQDEVNQDGDELRGQELGELLEGLEAEFLEELDGPFDDVLADSVALGGDVGRRDDEVPQHVDEQGGDAEVSGDLDEQVVDLSAEGLDEDIDESQQPFGDVLAGSNVAGEKAKIEEGLQDAKDLRGKEVDEFLEGSQALVDDQLDGSKKVGDDVLLGNGDNAEVDQDLEDANQFSGEELGKDVHDVNTELLQQANSPVEEAKDISDDILGLSLDGGGGGRGRSHADEAESQNGVGAHV